MQNRRRSYALALALIPGWGHVYWGREFLGLVFFTVAALLGFAWINGKVIYHGAGRETLVWASGIAFFVFAIAVWFELFWRTRPVRVAEEQRARLQRLERGTAAYLRDEFTVAIDEFRGCLRDQPQDVEALFRLGIVLSRSGDTKLGRRTLRKAARFDLEDKWRWEIERELTRMQRASRGDEKPSEEREEETEHAAA